jgi:glycosyltransferase involved in cell wall biosynthesis
MKLNICMVTSEYPPNKGGISSYVHNLVKKQCEKGNKVFVITKFLGHGIYEENREGIRVIKVGIVPVPPFHLIDFGNKACNIINKKIYDVDVIHVQIPGVFIENSNLSGRTSLVITVHQPTICDVTDIPYKEILSDKRLFYIHAFKKYINKKESQMLSHFDRLIFTTNYGLNEASKAYNADIPEEKYSIVPCGIDIKKFRPLHVEESTDILFVGNLVPRKGLTYLLYAISAVKDELPWIKLTIASKDNAKKYMNLSKKLEIFQNCEWIYNPSEQELVRLYNSCKIFILPSLFEGFGIVLLEAQACGKPVISSSVGGISEALMDGKTGFLIKPGDVATLSDFILKLLSNDQLREKMGKSAREFAEKFSWDKIATSIEHVYLKSLGR